MRARLRLLERALLYADLQREQPLWRHPHLRRRGVPAALPAEERLHLARRDVHRRLLRLTTRAAQPYFAARRPFDLEGLTLVDLEASAFFIVSW